jgi:hypothetical protein
MKWFFGANLHALQRLFDQIYVAVKSAKARTALSPHLLVDDRDGLDEVADRLSWLEQAGVSIIRHQAELFEIVRNRFGPRADWFSGHWLRCDIPILETEDEFVLYTDIDVLFRHNIDFSGILPPFLACAPEHHREDFSYFNSGVMIMNLPALRESRAEFVETVKRPGWECVSGSLGDQSCYNITYRDRWTRLPDIYNWKPYWGYTEEAAIVHFHGPKPFLVRRRLILGKEEEKESNWSPRYSTLFRWNPYGYIRYLAEFDAIREMGRDHLSRARSPEGDER